MRFVAAFMAWASLAAAAQDLATLPAYHPRVLVSGAIRVCGSDHMAGLVREWAAAFRKVQPDVVFEEALKGTAAAQFGLHVDRADIALSGRQLFPYEYYGIYRRSQLQPVEIEVATGAFDVRGKSTALGVFVHPDNPLAGLTLEQLDRIYGDERTGGWQGIEWVTRVARGPDQNIRTWGQLGLTGEWADKPIHVYGPPGLYPGGVSYFQARVMGGADTWNEALVEFDDRAAMLRTLANDRYGIAYAGLSYRTPAVKIVALAPDARSPYVAPTRASIADRSYPLARSAYLYLAPDTPTGDPARPDAKVREFLRFVLSREGQEAVAREGDHLPLTPRLLRAQLRKLDGSPEEP